MKRGNDFEYLDQEDDIEKLNEFTNLFKKKEKVEEVNVMVKKEINEIKSAYEKLKEYLQIPGMLRLLERNYGCCYGCNFQSNRNSTQVISL